jgi:hypothetical protein
MERVCPKTSANKKCEYVYTLKAFPACGMKAWYTGVPHYSLPSGFIVVLGKDGDSTTCQKVQTASQFQTDLFVLLLCCSCPSWKNGGLSVLHNLFGLHQSEILQPRSEIVHDGI